MQQQTTGKNYFEQLIHFIDVECEAKKRDVRTHESVFLQVQKDIEALNTKEFYFNPVLDRAYVGRGVFRFTVPAYTTERRTRILCELVNRGYDYTPDSTDDVRILKRDQIYFIITLDPIKPAKG